MPGQGYYLSEKDRQVIQQFLDASKRRQTPRVLDSASRDSVHHEEQQAPEVYVALSPAGGIPALTPASAGTATFDNPGYADCDVYEFRDALAPTGLVGVPHLRQRVYNLTSRRVPAGLWVVVFRDKFGKWLVDPQQFPFPARLTGGTYPYAWVEQTEGTGGTFSDRPGGRTGSTSVNQAYELSGKRNIRTGAAGVGTVVWMYPGSPGEYLFSYDLPTVKQQGGIPTVNSTEEIQFKDGDFLVQDLGSNKALIKIGAGSSVSVVTNVCPSFTYLSGYSLNVMTGIQVERSVIYVAGLSVAGVSCVTSPHNCCPVVCGAAIGTPQPIPRRLYLTFFPEATMYSPAPGPIGPVVLDYAEPAGGGTLAIGLPPGAGWVGTSSLGISADGQDYNTPRTYGLYGCNSLGHADFTLYETGGALLTDPASGVTTTSHVDPVESSGTIHVRYGITSAEVYDIPFTVTE